jgi:RNA polymerase sigma-70 factor (ECF subfamily)
VAQDSSPALEGQVREALAAGQLELCATLVLRGYGPEILGYLLGRLGDESQAAEVFAMFSEDLWRGLPGLELEVSMRAYAYALARNAAHRLLDRRVRHDRKQVPLSDAHVVSQLAHEVRVATLPHLQTGVKDAVAELRKKLSEEEQLLLTLRIDRDLSWLEIAVVLTGEAPLEPDQLKRASARLRKRFELTKDKLRRLAIEAGLLSDENEP